MNISRGKLRKMQSNRRVGFLSKGRHFFVLAHLLVEVFRVQTPHHNVMVDATGNELLTISGNVDGENLVAVTTNAGKDCDAR